MDNTLRQPQTTICNEPICNELLIAADIQTVYDYVTRPDRWHEWHPTSVSAETGFAGSLPTGHRFTEVIDLLGLRVDMAYEVLLASPPLAFETVFSSNFADGSIAYLLTPHPDGTLFRRTLEYAARVNVDGLRRRMVELSDTAVQRLKLKLESLSHTPS